MRSIKRRIILLLILLVSNFFVWNAVYYYSQEEFTKVCFLDVGQGSAVFIKTEKNQQILIDGGPDKKILEKLSSEMPFWDHTIDLIILTHPQKDHIYGLLEVLKNYQVKNILWTGAKTDTSLFKQWQNLIKEEGANVKIADQGLKIYLTNNAYLSILWPAQDFLQDIKEINDTSIVSKFYSYQDTILFTGDITDKIEYNLIDQRINLDSDILQIPHHGSRYSSSDPFLSVVSPSLAVISAGKNNKYKFPHQEVLERLKKYDIKVLSTINEGDICLIQKKKKPFFLLSPMELKED
ncbi:MBL fold metallo-hydrolase [bacterium]|nr:MBL fold metallo-hydrolase [bacterium]